MKKIELEIRCCADCPYHAYSEWDDVGISFGFDYYCSKGAKQSFKADGTPYDEGGGAMNIGCAKRMIRPDCPLEDA